MLLYILFAPLVLYGAAEELGDRCKKNTSCGKCVQTQGCFWCPTMSLCTDSSTCEEVVGQVTKPITTPGNDMNPKYINAQIRVNEPLNIEFTYRVKTNYPIDLYYLMDASNSMKPYKERLASLSQEIFHRMSNVTTELSMGFGTFIDKPTLPYFSTDPDVNKPHNDYEPAYSFKNQRSLRKSDFQKELNNLPMSGNLDDPEGGLEALMQVMMCKKQIGWNDGAVHIIVFSTDGEFHIAGDGRLAGIVIPNDENCHMEGNSYTASLIYDYPSISQISKVTNDTNFKIYFNIVDSNNGVYQLYETISNLLQESSITRLEKQSNLPEQIVTYAEGIVRQVTMSNSRVGENVEITYESDAGDEVVGQLIHYTANIIVKSCNAGDKYNFTIKPTTVESDEGLHVDLDVLCECSDCNKKIVEKNSDKCGQHGDLVCGSCKCFKDFTGENCACLKSGGTVQNKESCTKNNIECSHQGKCVCGKCECDADFGGDHCECDNSKCSKDGKTECSNRGTCKCGTCSCTNPYFGNHCECDRNKCFYNGSECNGQGDCVCETCRCWNGYVGNRCEESPTHTRCDEIAPCVECKEFKRGPYNEKDCEDKCKKWDITSKEKIEIVNSNAAVKTCKIEHDCTIYYTYEKNTVLVQTNEVCPEPFNYAKLMGILIPTIILAALLLLLLWKGCTYWHDKREYQKFETEKAKSAWNVDKNPLFKSPVSTFSNPTYSMTNLAENPESTARQRKFPEESESNSLVNGEEMPSYHQPFGSQSSFR